jgi:hypothetical protein
MATLGQVACSGLIGSVVGALPWLLSKLPIDSHAFDLIASSSSFLLFPGAIIGLIASLGRVHDINLGIMIASNCLIYSILVYYLLRKRNRFKK